MTSNIKATDTWLTVFFQDKDKEGYDVALVHAVAAGRLYIQNEKGEMEQVTLANYWRDHENGYYGICTISVGGNEFDENGETTRTFTQSSTGAP